MPGTRSRIKRPLGTVPPRDPPMSPTPVRGVAPMMVATETHAIEPCGCEESVALRASVERLRSIADTAIGLLPRRDAASLRARLDGVP